MLLQAHAEHAAGAAGAATGGFLPHGYCYLWNTPLVVTHVVSDVLIGLAYVAISVALAWLVHRARREIPFSAVFVAFGLFIITCGITHFVEVWTLWQPVYWFSGAVKAVTAVASVATAAVMPVTVPRALATIRDARLSRERELAAARADALAAQNTRLEQQARELEAERAAASELAVRLEEANALLRAALDEAERERARADAERMRAEQARGEAEAARETAEQANAAKGQFLATMSHELRTPLNAIGGYAQLLEMELRGPLTPEQRSDLGRVRRAQQHLLALINDVLSFARIEAGRVDYRAEEVDVQGVVEDAVALVMPQATAEGQTIATDVPAGLCAHGDREKVAQVLVNLLSNAHKYAGRGARVAIEARVEDGAAVLRVRDDGPGVTPGRREAVFEPFVQAVGGLNRPHEGTGLGLAISRELARGMGGDLVLEDVPGGGASFALRLPLEAAVAA